MIPGLNGSLLSEEALERVVPDRLRGMLDEFGRRRAQRQLRAWHLPLRQRLGPACSPRTIFDRLAVPLFSQLGYHLVAMDAPRRAAMSAPEPVVARLDAGGATRAVLLVTGWGQDASSVWREAVRHGIAHGRRWCFCLTGPAIRVFDAVRTYSRRFVEFDVAAVADNEKTFAVFWGLLRAGATTPDGTGLLDRAVSISEEHREAVRSSLQEGVQEALHHVHRALMAAVVPRQLRATRGNSQVVFDEALQIVYRILFLLFAEARGLVPRWHPAYRDAYTIDALRVSVELVARPRGLWEALQSISRLAHRGCRIGALRVTAFNGHLFSPHESPLADALALDDGAVRQALLSLTTRESRAGRQRISYGDLGVEQLGGVYERLLDVEPASMVERRRAPAPSGRIRAKAAHSEPRKATGSFYTPRSLTEYLVRRTLAPLVQHASPDRILALRILDPAMGSGAFLVAACRYLAAAYESALLARRRRQRRGDRRARAGRLPPCDCAALPLRRRFQPGGGAARPPVVVAGNPFGGSATHVSGSPRPQRQQPGRRHARRSVPGTARAIAATARFLSSTISSARRSIRGAIETRETHRARAWRHAGAGPEQGAGTGGAAVAARRARALEVGVRPVVRLRGSPMRRGGRPRSAP